MTTELGVGKILQVVNMINWDKEFSEAIFTSGPITHGLTISKVKPNGNNSRSIWEDDKKEIMAAAKKYKYRILFENNSVVSFTDRPLKSMLDIL